MLCDRDQPDAGCQLSCLWPIPHCIPNGFFVALVHLIRGRRYVLGGVTATRSAVARRTFPNGRAVRVLPPCRQSSLYPHCFGRENRRPLKVGICEEVIAQHPELSRHRVKRLLKEYTQHELYWSTLKTGTPRTGLDGNVAGEVTLEDEQHALIQVARMAHRAAAREAEARKAAAQAAEKRAEQQKPTSEAKSQQPRLDHLASVSQASRPLL
jgi:ProQ/FINO family